MEFMEMMIAFAPLFSQRVWPHALTPVIGVLWAPGKRTMSQLLRVMGLADEPQCQRYHRVLNRVVWSSRQASRIFLNLLVNTFASDGVIVMGLHDSIERRWGKRIAVQGIYRDPVRSSPAQFVKTSGLRWLGTNAIGADSLGPARLGFALVDRTGPVRALQPNARATAQSVNGLG